MKYRIMLTSLYGGNSAPNVEYYIVRGEKKKIYCDAILSAEAGSKYVLANYRIDEIITLGSHLTYDEGDEQVRMILRDGSSFYASDINELSTYSLFRYRLAQYIDELRIEEQDLRDLLSEEEQKDTIEFLKSFFRRNLNADPNAKFNRFFDILVTDDGLRAQLFDELNENVPAEEQAKYRRWVRNYLYGELRDTSKLELLNGNENVSITFIPTDEGGAMSFAGKLRDHVREIVAGDDEPEIEFYICIQSDDAKDTFTLLNFMDIAKSMPGNIINIKKVVTGTHTSEEFYNEISDDTELYSTSNLLAATRSFLQYGKTDLLMQFWSMQKTRNPFIEHMLFAMRNIDIGISLCDIGDIERGINSLRRLFAEEEFVPGDSIFEKYFEVIIEGIKRDYGVLLSGERVEFIDLVKWAYRKGFWQQTLTLVESKAPDDFVERGIYYYAADENSKEKAIRILGRIFYDFKPYEKYKLDDVAHYFIKFYDRSKIGRTNDKREMQERYTKIRIQEIGTDDPEDITAFTATPDIESLSGLLYAYYNLGDVRNSTNHAADESSEFEMKANDSDVGERMDLIKHAIENFIYMYDEVIKDIGDREANVVYVTNDEIRAYANTLRPHFGGKGDKKFDKPRNEDRDNRDNREDKNGERKEG